MVNNLLKICKALASIFNTKRKEGRVEEKDWSVEKGEGKRTVKIAKNWKFNPNLSLKATD